ncbi:hypothetical protein J5X84_32020 [Streptosporangiaceae bacterium NEAU-GS5]|nr:hypothetical protein [Streptosporangiaceae bacterium NEAU-GS5]
MDRDQIIKLQQPHSTPAVSVLMPAHRHAPENAQDPIRLGNLLAEAERQLTERTDKECARRIMAELEQAAEMSATLRPLDALALYAAEGEHHAFSLPFTVGERVVLADTFDTRDLVRAYDRARHYWVLALSENDTRMFLGSGDQVREIHGDGFPLTHTGPGGAQQLPGGLGINPSAHRDERHRQFFRQVADATEQVVKHDDLPLIVLGVDRYHAFLDEVSGLGKRVTERVLGNYDSASPAQIAEVVEPAIADYVARRQDQVMEELDRARSAKLYVTGVDEIWPLVEQGRGAHLVVEESYHAPGHFEGDHFVAGPAGDTHDAVDDIIEMAMATGAFVSFVTDGALATEQGLALIARY